MNKNLMIGLITMFSLVLVSAAIVEYWGSTEIDMKIEEAISVIGGEHEVSLTAGGDYGLYLFEATNNLDQEVNADFIIRIQKKDASGEYVSIDDAGVLVAVTEDVSYCFSTECVDAPNEWKSWMQTNTDWLDWYTTKPYPTEYDTSIITNYEGDSVTDISSYGVDGVYSLPNSVKALDTFQVAIYVDSQTALEAGDYKVTFEVAPIAA